MKTNYKANGIEFTIDGESLFIHIDHMFTDLPVTKARIDEFCGDNRQEAYGQISKYTRGIYNVIKELEDTKHD